MILFMKPEPQLPILVLTYENHALDEFLKGCLNFLGPDEIVRIGGRSKEKELDSSNLRNIQEKALGSVAVQSKITEIIVEKSLIKEELDNHVQELQLDFFRMLTNLHLMNQ